MSGRLLIVTVASITKDIMEQLAPRLNYCHTGDTNRYFILFETIDLFVQGLLIASTTTSYEVLLSWYSLR